MTEGPKESRADPVGEFQRWLFRSGTRGLTRELGDQIRALVGRSERSGDVWESATADPPLDAPECTWCPVCRAARMLRESSPGLATRMTTASGLLTGVAQDAMSAVESVLAGAGRADGSGRGEERGGAASPWDRAGEDHPQHSPSGAPAGESEPAGPTGTPLHGSDHRG